MSYSPDQFGRVAVLMGGISSERAVSLKSGQAVLHALRSQGVDAHGVDANPQNIGNLQTQGFERVFIMLHGTWGEDGVVQGALQAINMPYTGSGVLGSALAMDKVRSKQIWQNLNLPTAPYRALSSKADLSGLADVLGLPLFLKPACEGSSVGVKKVQDEQDLDDAYDEVAALTDVVLAEQFLSGAELTCGVLDGEALPVIRMQTGNEFYDYEAKYQSNETQYVCPAGLSDALEQEVRSLSLRAFDAVGAQHWGRVDIMLDENEQPLLLEVNTVPGMTDHSLVPIAAAAAGLSFEELVLRILATTLKQDVTPKSEVCNG